MFQHILVPLDGSLRAERAIPVAARLVRLSKGEMILLRVVTMRSDFLPAAGVVQPVQIVQAVVDADFAEAEQYLADLTVTNNLAGIPTKRVVLSGNAAAAILSAVSAYHADTIVLCSHGYTGMKRWIIGSVAQKVVHHAPVPVLLLRENGPLPGQQHVERGGPIRVLVPLDGSAYAKTALAPAARLSAALSVPERGALHLLRVAKPDTTVKDEDHHEQGGQHLHKAEVYLKTATEHLQAGLVAPQVAPLNLAITWSVPINDDVADAIIQAAEYGGESEGTGVFDGCDVIAMATHGRHGFQRWAMGSITERVMHATRLPLLIIRPERLIEKNDLTGKEH